MTSRTTQRGNTLRALEFHPPESDVQSAQRQDGDVPARAANEGPPRVGSDASGFAYRFGGFTLFPAQEVLLYADQAVRVGSRALAILVLLLQKSGELVSSKDIFDQVWPGVFVEPNNLRVHMSALRRVLEEHSPASRFIINVPGRGYRFVAAVESGASDTQSPNSPPRPNDLPLPLTHLIGRDAALDDLERQLTLSRLLTIVGPGGIGKTRVALASVARFIKTGPYGGCFVDLASLTDPRLVPSAIALALQLPVAGADALTDLLGRLRNQSLVLILDNCEHLIDVIAETAEAILLVCSDVKIVATSREALRVAGETLYQLAALDLPAPNPSVTADAAAASPAIKLFVDRASAAAGAFRLTDENAATVCAICKRLDGVPLAIELAAASVAVLNLTHLADNLNDRLPLLGEGRRTIDRHRTLRATLDWSHALLDDAEREMLAILSVFRGGFTLEAATAVGSGRLSDNGRSIASIVMTLTAKSLLSAESSGSPSRFRLLETTRAYAAEKLAQTHGEVDARRRHADHFRASLEQSAQDWLSRPRTEWWETYGRQLDDVRAGLDWALAAGGDEHLGVLLTAASIPLWIGLSKLSEFRVWLEMALSRIGDAGLADSSVEIRLNLSLYTILFNTEGPGPEAGKTLHRALEVARRLGDERSEQIALWALAGAQHVAGEYGNMLFMAYQVAAKANHHGDPESIAMAQRFLALAHHRIGSNEKACHISRRLIANETAADVRFAIAHHDHGSSVRGNLAGMLWLGGRADQAREMMADSLERAERAQNPASLCYLLSHEACPLAFWLGDDAAAKVAIKRLIEVSDENGFTYMRWWAWAYTCLAATALNPTSPRDDALKAGMASFRGLERDILISIRGSLLDDAAARRAVQQMAGWCSPELLRASGEARLARFGAGESEAAGALFAQAIALAREQGALAWELRAAHSLARLQATMGSRAEGVAILEPVISKFTEGFGALDYTSAAAWLRR